MNKSLPNTKRKALDGQVEGKSLGISVERAEIGEHQFGDLYKDMSMQLENCANRNLSTTSASFVREQEASKQAIKTLLCCCYDL